MASGGTDYGAGIYALVNHRPDPNEDVLFFFVGDEEAYPFSDAVRASALNPLAFGFVKVGRANAYNGVRTTATEMGIPCFLVNPQTFDDPYAVPRTIRNLIASTPVSKVERPKSDWQYTRLTLVDQILKTPLLQKPSWA
jgi:hypothetical protein